MGKRYNIMQRSLSILIITLLVLSSINAIIASGKCDNMCSIHDHMQKKIKSCCHSDIANLLLIADQVCSMADNPVTEFPALKTQINRSLSQKDLSYSNERKIIAYESFSQFGSLHDYSTVHSKCKLAPLYLLDSVSLT